MVNQLRRIFRYRDLKKLHEVLRTKSIYHIAVQSTHSVANLRHLFSSSYFQMILTVLRRTSRKGLLPDFVKAANTDLWPIGMAAGKWVPHIFRAEPC